MGRDCGYRELTFAELPSLEGAAALLDRIAATPAEFGPRPVDKPLVLYGAGNLGHMAAQYLRHVGIPFDYVVDASAAQHRADPFWAGTRILAPDEVSPEEQARVLLAVCISTVPYGPVHRSLTAKGWPDVVPFYDVAEAYRDRHPLSNGWFADQLSDADRAGMHEVLGRWEDPVSRAHQLQFFAWRRLREEWLFPEAPVTVADRYFIPQVRERLGSREALLDLGAHHGEVSIAFARAVGERFREIVAVEPDPDNLAVLRREIAAALPAPAGRIAILDRVLAQQEGSALLYDGLGYATQLCAIGPRRVATSTIDQLHADPTFLKLHLEGWELEVLKGGMETIRRCRPIIAATAYHNRLGLWELPHFLMQELEGYRFLLRLHGWCATGLVLYAIPAERQPDAGSRSA